MVLSPFKNRKIGGKKSSYVILQKKGEISDYPAVNLRCPHDAGTTS